MQKSIDRSPSSIFRPMPQPCEHPDALAQQVDGHVVPASEALEFAKTQSKTTEGKKAQVLIVDMRGMESTPSDLEKADTIRDQVDQLMNQATDGNVLSIMSSTASAPGRKLLWTETHNIATSTSTATWGFFPMKTGAVWYLTSNSLLGLGVTMYLFFIAFCGFCCLSQLQTPDVFMGDQKEEMDRALGKNTK
eukprot:TRINITY_DN12636_c0_g1_i10.p1 TRINITY_DN12636_c0_g1~~TRINITY_DN12636_c0_g1_i10.p1  ORF type:complete len:192 (+),score=67.07 TRINITY_DN12636_c0_g1_i10:245-820(+)